MVRFIIVRHGYSKSNEQGFFTGRTDVPLADLGHLQALKTAEFIHADFSIDAIYSSPLTRAKQTATPIAQKFSLPIFIEPDLAEIDGGEWEKKTTEQLLTFYKEEYTLWLTDIGTARCTGGESMREVQARALAAMRKIAKENEGKTVLITTHAGVLRALQCAIQEIPLTEMKNVPWMPNASCSFVRYDNEKFTADKLAYDEHLKQLKN